MQISISDLKKLSEKILTKAEILGLKEIEVDIDYYWDIEDLYNLNVENPTTMIGSFIDDWESLQKVLNDQNPPSIVDFDRLGNVIKIIGDSIEKSKNAY